MAICSVIAIYEMMSCIGLKKAYVLTVPLYLAALGLPFLVRYAGILGTVRQAVTAISLAVVLYFFAVLTGTPCLRLLFRLISNKLSAEIL